MAVIKKFAENLTQTLSSFGTFLIDSDPNSQYFKITQFKDTFTGGKNGFLIEGSEHLKESTEIKIQILDVDGNPVYYEPGNGIPEYYEGTSKLIAVYVYEDTPIGTAKITILGELKTYVDEGGVVTDIPDDWKGVYNLKWEKTFQINRLLSNEDNVRFYKRPVVGITEIVKPIFNNVTTTITQTGSLSGIAQSPQAGQPLLNFTIPTSYLLRINDNTNWTGSIVGSTINVPSLDYSAVVDSVINNKSILVNKPYTNTSLGSAAPVENFLNQGYTASFNYVEGVNNLKTALTGSFAKIRLTDLTTFVGDCARVKIFRKSQSDLADYQFIQEIRLESNEILRDLESQTKNEEFYGVFDNINYKNYWVTSSNNLSTSFNQDYLYNSLKFDSTGINNFYTSKSLDIAQGTEYTLNFNLRVSPGQILAGNYINVFLSGSRQSTLNSLPTTVQIKQNIITITSDSSLLQKNELTANFKAEELTNAKLYFEIKGNAWHLADISLRASQETAYSPDEITFIQSVPRTLPEETFDYRFEFYDINNNYIPVLVEASKTFNGGNLQRIQKGLVFNPRSLQFQFDSGSSPVPPTVVGFTVTKNLLTGSVTYTSQSFDFDGNELFGDNYTSSITLGGGYPGLLDDITSDNPTMTVQHFTGSRTDKIIQLVKITGEVEGFTDTVIFSRVLDGFGGVNYVIRPYRGTQIKNSSTSSLEVQAVRIDGVNDIELSSTTKPEKGWPDVQLHIISRSLEGNEKFVNLAFASSSRYILGLTTGSLGSKEINYNAVFNRDSIDVRRTIYMMSSGSAASGPAFQTSGSVLASIILEDLQDGLDTPVITYNTDTFNIDPRTETLFRPTFAIATASFYKRGTAEPITASFRVFPSMSINRDWTPEYWLYYTTQSVDPTITVTAIDEARRTVETGALNSVFRSPLSQSKNLTVKFTYTEPYNSPSSATASISIDKTFTIVPQGTAGDETIVFEVNPISVTLASNPRGIVNDYRPSITDIRVKQGARYLSFTGSAASDPFFSHGQFYIASSSIIERRVKAGNIHFTSSFGTPYTASLIVSQSSNFSDLTGSITYPLVIHPYFTSSIYTASVVVNYTKVLDGPPPIQIVVSPTSVSIPADEVGYVSSYTNANTNITVKEGDDFLLYNTSSLPGTWKINRIATTNIRTGSLVTGSASSSLGTFNRFDYPFVSASANYTIQVYPFALGSGHQYTSSIFERTQTFTKNVSVPNARTVELKANPYTINYDRDGYRVSPEGDVELKATAQNYTGSTWFSLFFIDTDGSETLYDGPYYEGIPEYTFFVPGTDAAGPGENKTWKVKLTDGNPYTSSILNPYRAEAQLTIAGIKAGADAYKISATNESTSIKAELFDTDLTGTAIKLPTYKGTTSLINVTSGNYPSPQPTDYDYLQNLIGILGYSSASIFYKSPWIGLPTNRVTTNPASMPDISGWEKPAINKTGEIVYKVDFEGYSNQVTTNNISRPPSRQTQFITQSFAVQFTEPAPYDVKMQNENSSAVYRVSGELELGSTSNIIRAYRGGYELTNKPSGFTGAQIDAYGSSSYEYQCTVEVTSKSSHITLDSGNIIVGSLLSGTPASMPGVTSWFDPENNPTAEIVYGINCEGRQTIYKTQSLAVQFEGAVGPGIVMRGEWSQDIDYIGMVETTNNRRDAVTYLATPDTVKYYASISGSGPTTLDQNGVSVGYHAPTPNGTNAWWEYLGDEEFFVAAKIAIFEESYVKNTINVGTKNGTGAFANIVIAGGRTDPYIAIGQNATIGTSGTAGSTLNPGGSVIGYNRPGIFLGIYEDGGNGTTGRFSIKTTGTSGKGLFWDGDVLTIIGAIRQVEPGVSEGSLRGAWTSGFTYFANDIVAYQGQSWQCTSATSHVATNNTNSTTGYPGAGPWTIAAAAGTSGTAGSGGTAGTAGGPGPGVVYRGPFVAGTQYFNTPTRRDVVQGTNGQYYLCKLTYTPSDNTTRPIDGGSYTTYWETFGATFSSVATNILLAQDATITRGLVIGTDGLTDGFIRSTGATSLTSGTAPGFYLQQDGQFRFGQNVSAGNPYIYWNNNVLEIRGKILTDNTEVSEIGNWRVDTLGNFRDSSDGIVLNATSKAIQVFDTGGTKRVEIKQGNISSPTGGSSTVTVNPMGSYDYGFGETLTGPANFYSDSIEFDTVGFTVSTAGTYTISTLNWGTDGGMSATADSNFDGSLWVGITARIYDTPDDTGNLVDTIFIASFPNGVNGPLDEDFSVFNDGFSDTLTFPTAGTYYMHILTSVSGYASAGSVTLYGSVDAQSQTYSAQLEQVELGQNGLLVIANSNNYVKIERTTSLPMIDIKTNGSAPGIQITNTNASPTSKAIEVLAGDVLVSGTGNNIMVAGGYIGTQNTTGGIRFQTDGANSVLVGANWPSQSSNVATARLRIGTKLGITGRELIFDSSTIRVKTNIEDYPNNAYDSIKRLKPILYTPLKVVDSNNYITDGEDDYTNSYPMPNAKEYIGKQGGFIAEWMDADPELRRYVSYGISGSLITTDAVNYDMIVVPLTKAVQILMDKVESLEAYISSSK
jgi:hypothetical protein